jgi:thioesterase domain-containing protein
MALADSPTVAKLAAWIVQNLRDEGGATAEQVATADQYEMRAQIARVAGQHASEMAAEDIDRMASQLRAGGSGANQRMIH